MNPRTVHPEQDEITPSPPEPLSHSPVRQSNTGIFQFLSRWFGGAAVKVQGEVLGAPIAEDPPAGTGNNTTEAGIEAQLTQTLSYGHHSLVRRTPSVAGSQRSLARSRGSDHGRIHPESALHHQNHPSLYIMRKSIARSYHDLKVLLQSTLHPPPTPQSAVPQRKQIRVYIGTWNMNGKLPQTDLSDFFPPKKDRLYEILVFGSQECQQSLERSVVFPAVPKDLWEALLNKELISRNADDKYTMVASETLAGLHMCVFVLNERSEEVKNIEYGRVATGLGQVLGNKGAVAISLSFASSSLLFVCCHLSAHQNNVDQRNADCARICAELRLSPAPADAPLAAARTFSRGPTLARKPSTLSTGTLRRRERVLDNFDYVFFFGDLNYRVNGNRAIVEQIIAQERLEVLRNNDQLRIEMEKGKILSGFQEASINFPPTFKFDLPVSGELYSPSTASGSSLTTPTSPSATEPISPARGKVAFPDGIPWDGGSYTLRYDTSPKARIPSWTDRVLYKSKRRTHTTPSLSLPTTPQGTRTFEDGLAEALVVENYKACLGVGGSDHVPVVCAFTLYPESSQEEGVVRSSNSVDIREIDTRETSEKDAGLNSARQKRCIIS